MSGLGGLLRRLQAKELILPYLETAIQADNWPDSYLVTVDSAPYYGRGDGYFHPSTHALMDERQLYLMFHPDTRDKMRHERKTLASHMTLSMGSALHAIVQTQFQMAGLITGDEMVEWEYVNEPHHVRGRIDFIVHHPNGQVIPVELKTTNPRVFSHQETIKESWDAQLSIGLDNYGAEMGVLLLLEAGYPFRMREFHVPRNDVLVGEIYSKFDRVRAAIDLSLPPRHCCEINSEVMKGCPARMVCWMNSEGSQ